MSRLAAAARSAGAADAGRADLVNVFGVFLPQLLLYPNPTDPLIGEAASLMLHDKDAYDERVRGAWQPRARRRGARR